MQTIECDPEVRTATTPSPRSASSSKYDIALVAAVLGPLVLFGLFTMIGFSAATAVCIMFVAVFAVTTTLDVRWLIRRRRASADWSRCAA